MTNNTTALDAIRQFISKHEKALLYFAVFLTFLLIFGDINRTGYYSDDLVYQNIYSTYTKIQSFSDILYSQKIHWATWGGRNIVHGILQWLLWIGKPYASLIGSAVYVFLIIITAKGLNIQQPLTFINYTLTAGLFYFFNPDYSETVIWMTGNANYVIGTFLVVISIFLDMHNDKQKYILPLLFVLAFISGWCNENTSATLCLYFLISAVIHFLRKKEKALSLRFPEMSGSFSSSFIKMIFCGCGFLLMILAPGNFIRSGVATEGLDVLGQILVRIYNLNHVFMYVLFLIILLNILILLKSYRSKDIRDSMLLFILGLVSVLVMGASPYFPERAAFGSMVFFLSSIMSLVNQYSDQNHLIMTTSLISWFAFVMNLLPSLILTLLGLRE